MTLQDLHIPGISETYLKISVDSRVRYISSHIGHTDTRTYYMIVLHKVIFQLLPNIKSLKFTMEIHSHFYFFMPLVIKSLHMIE